MNQRASTRTSLRLRRALHCLALLLLPALAPGFIRAVPRSRLAPGPVPATQPREMPRPYLPAVGAPPLRFLETAPPPDLVTRPPASGTPPGSVEGHGAESELQPAADSPDREENPAATDPTPAATPEKTEAGPPKVGPAPILPDDLPTPVRPEDFLPFFQLPGTGNAPADVTVIAPVPRQAPAPPVQPPSSATYRQTP